MQITPIMQLKRLNITKSPEEKVSTNIALYPQNNTDISNIYYQPVNFKSKLTPGFVKEMQNLENVHCPICGTKMLNSDELKNVFNDIPQIVTGEQLQEFIAKYKDYVNPLFGKMLEALDDTINANPNTSSNEILKILKSQFDKQLDNKLQNLQINLKNIATMPETPASAKPNLLLAIKQVKYLPQNVSQFNFYKNLNHDILHNAFGYLSGTEKRHRINDLLQIVKQSIFVSNLFYKGEENYTEKFCSRLLINSKSDLKKVIHTDEAVPKNMALTCRLCESSNNRFAFHRYEHKDNYYNYVYDMAHRVLVGELTSNKTYPVELLEYIKKRFNYRITPDDSNKDLKALYKLLNITPLKNNEMLPLVHEKGINCAYCGQKTITHEEKQELFTQISNANTPRELAIIMDSKKDVLKPMFKPLIEHFMKLSLNETCKEENILPALQKFLYKNFHETCFSSIKNLNNLIKTKHLEGEEKYGVLNIIREIDKQLLIPQNKKGYSDLAEYRKKFFEYTAFLPKTSELRTQIWNLGYYPFADNIFLQETLMPSQKLNTVMLKVGSKLKLVLQNIIRHSVATVDHMDPRKNYSSPPDKPDHYKRYLGDRTSNVVLSCSDCNHKKNDMNFKLWVSRCPNILTNFKNYLKQIRELQKSKDIKYNVYEVGTWFEKLSDTEIFPL